MAIDKLTTSSFLDESVTNLKIAVSARASTVISSASVGDLSDVDITTSSPSSGQTLVWDNANSKFIPGTSFSQSDFDNALTASDTDDLSEGTTNLYYTDARADARVALVIDSAPATLNTLNELASALGDDANFSTTVTNSIADKLPLAGGTMTGNLTLGDNVNLYLGDSSDASLVFDGTDTTLTSQGELILNGQTGVTIDCNNVTNQPTLILSDIGAGNTGILLGRASGGSIMYGQSMDHSRPKAITGTNKSLGFYVAGSQGNASYAAFDFAIDANASSRHPAVMGVRSPNNNALLFQGEQSDSTVVFSVDYDGNIATSGTVDGRNVATDGTKLDTIETNAKDDQTITAGAGLTGGGTGDVTLSHAATSSQVSLNNSGRTYIQDITLDTYGHITSLATATETVTNTNLTHTGEVTGSTSLTISNNVVDEANLKVSNAPTDGYFLSAQSGNAGGLTWATVPAGYTDSDVASYLSTNDYDTSTNIIAAITDSAPGTLDTLNELAAALGDDNNFSTTVTTSIAAKLPLAGGTMTGDINFGDNDKAIFGASNNLEIYYDGTIGFNMVYATSPLFLASTGNIWIGGDSIGLGNPGSSEYFVQCVNNGEVKLYHDNAEKLATTSTGIDVTGVITTDGMTTSGNVGIGTTNPTVAAGTGLVINGSTNQARLALKNDATGDGSGDGFQIVVTSGSGSNGGQAILEQRENNIIAFKTNGSEAMRILPSGNVGIGTEAPALQSGGTGLHIHGSSYSEIKLTNTTSGTGANDGVAFVTANNSFTLNNRSPGSMNFRTNNTLALTITASQLVDFAGDIKLADSKIAYFGVGNDLQIYSDGTNSFIKSPTGDLSIRSSDLFLQNANGTKYFEGKVDATHGTYVNLYQGGGIKLQTVSGGVYISGNVALSGTVDGRDVAADGTKLDGIEASADVTDTANVTAAGALMDSEVTNLAQVKAFDTSDYATAAQGTTADAALPKAGGTITGDVLYNDDIKAKFGTDSDLQVYHNGTNGYIINDTGNFRIYGDQGKAAINVASGYGNAVKLYYDGSTKLFTDNSYGVIMQYGAKFGTGGDTIVENFQNGTSSQRYFQARNTFQSGITDGSIFGGMSFRQHQSYNATAGITGYIRGVANGTSGNMNLEIITGTAGSLTQKVLIKDAGVDITGNIAVTGTVDGRDMVIDGNKLDGIEASADVTDTANVTSAGALMDSEVTNLAQVKAFDSSDYATAAQGTTADAALPKAGGTITGDILYNDNVKAKFGTSNDLEIYHDGSNSYIHDRGVGNLNIKTNVFRVYNAGGTEIMANFIQNGAAELYYDATKKFATSAAGINVTGNIVVSGTVDGRDVATDGTKLDTIATNANDYTHPNHTGEVTSTGDGATVIANNVVDEANLKVSNAPTNGYFLSAQSGNAGGLTWATVPAGYTDSDVQTYISGNRTYGNITTTGYIAGPATLTIDPAGVGDNTGKVVIAGDLQVDGTTTTINSTTLTVDDLNITLASGAANAAAANGAGITVDGASATIEYNSTHDEWHLSKGIKAVDYSVGDGTKVIDSSKRGYFVNLQNSSPISFLTGTNGVSGSGAQGINVRHVYAGTSYASSTAGAGDIEAKSNFKIAGNVVIDSSRNITSGNVNVTGNIAVSGTVDGVDIAARDAILTSTTTTANAALPKAGGTMTGDLQIYKAEPIITLRRSDNTLLPGIIWQGSGGSEAASIKMDGTGGMTNSLVMSTYNGSTMTERLRLVTAAAGGIAVTGTISVTGTVDGVDIAARDAILTSTTTTANTALPKAGGTMTGNLTVSIPDSGNSPATTAILQLNGYEGRGAGIKIKDSVNSAANANSQEWFMGTGYSQSAFNIGYSSTGSQTSYTAQNKLTITTAGDVGIGTASPQKKLEVTGDLQLDANNASIWLKSGAAGTDGRINWTYDTDSTVYASAGLDYDTRASTGFHLDVGYPITIDSSSSTGIKFITATAQRAVINNSGLSVTGNIAVSGTVDGVDIATRDGILTSTTTTANAALPKAGGVVTGNIDISGTNAIRHNGDTNTYMQFHDTDQWRVVTAGVERLEVNNNSMVVANTLSMNGHNIDMNNNDIVGVDQIVHEGDSNTYIRFHAEDQFQVVTGGTERLEVNNSGANVTGNITVSGTVDGRNVSTDGTKLDGIATGATANVGDITAVTAGTGLSGGGTSGSVTVNLSATTSPIVATELSNSIDLDTLNASQAGFYYQSANADTSGNNYPNGHAGSLIVQKSAGNATQLYQTYNSSSPELFFRSNYTTGYSAWRQVWHNYNDGSGSGLDADLLDGQHGSYYQKKTTVQDAAPSGATGDLWYESDSGSFYVYYGGAWVDVAPGVETNTNLQINSLGVGTAASGTSGEIRATNDVTAYYSDERLKDFHGNIDSALDKVNQLNGYYFTENETAKELGYDNDKRQVGVSAQEVEAVLPEVVAEAPISDEYLTVKYEKLAPLFIEAIKEIDKKYQDKIDMLMEEIEKLKGN